MNGTIASPNLDSVLIYQLRSAASHGSVLSGKGHHESHQQAPAESQRLHVSALFPLWRNLFPSCCNAMGPVTASFANWRQEGWLDAAPLQSAFQARLVHLIFL